MVSRKLDCNEQTLLYLNMVFNVQLLAVVTF